MTWLLLAGLFLPLFPFSVVFNAALARLQHPVLRFILLLVWPQIGVAALQLAGTDVPQAFLPWALSSAVLYGLRLLSVRDLGMYAGFLASSSLALTWGLAIVGADALDLSLYAFWFSLPAAMLALLAGPLTRQFGAAYAGLCAGLGKSLPRLSVVLILFLLAGIATAPFPAFFAQLTLLHKLDGASELAVLAIWLVWGWGASRLLQGFVFGMPSSTSSTDLSRRAVWALAMVLCIFTIAGLYLAGGKP